MPVYWEKCVSNNEISKEEIWKIVRVTRDMNSIHQDRSVFILFEEDILAMSIIRTVIVVNRVYLAGLMGPHHTKLGLRHLVQISLTYYPHLAFHRQGIVHCIDFTLHLNIQNDDNINL